MLCTNTVWGNRIAKWHTYISFAFFSTGETQWASTRSRRMKKHWADAFSIMLRESNNNKSDLHSLKWWAHGKASNELLARQLSPHASSTIIRSHPNSSKPSCFGHGRHDDNWQFHAITPIIRTIPLEPCLTHCSQAFGTIISCHREWVIWMSMRWHN